jgi:hypothetical protein
VRPSTRHLILPGIQCRALACLLKIADKRLVDSCDWTSEQMNEVGRGD